MLGVYGAVFSVFDGSVGFVSAGGGDFISLVIAEMLPFFLSSSSEVSIIVAGEPQSGQKRGSRGSQYPQRKCYMIQRNNGLQMIVLHSYYHLFIVVDGFLIPLTFLRLYPCPFNTNSKCIHPQLPRIAKIQGIVVWFPTSSGLSCWFQSNLPDSSIE